MEAPVLSITADDLRNLVQFIHVREQMLEEYGAIKICPTIDCAFALKKKRKTIPYPMQTERLAALNKHEHIYTVKPVSSIRTDTKSRQLRKLSVTDEQSFWSSLTQTEEQDQCLNISILPKTSFFSDKMARAYFSTHHLPVQSLLRIGGKQTVRRFTPCVMRAHASGAIFPLSSTRQRLFSIHYHHEGGARYWYTIPNSERQAVHKIMKDQKSSMCLDHSLLFINPTVLDKHGIRYSRILQSVREIVVLAAGALSQSFTAEAGWYESVEFALPSWITNGHATIKDPSCHCRKQFGSLLEAIDTSSFTDTKLQKYSANYLFKSRHKKTAIPAGAFLLP